MTHPNQENSDPGNPKTEQLDCSELKKKLPMAVESMEHVKPCQCGSTSPDKKQQNGLTSPGKTDQKQQTTTTKNNTPTTATVTATTSKPSSKISTSYAKLKRDRRKTSKSKSRKQLDRKNRQLLAKVEDPSSLPAEQGSWLLRLFESKLFDMPIAISYMFNSKEGGVLAYLGNKLFVSQIFFDKQVF